VLVQRFCRTAATPPDGRSIATATRTPERALAVVATGSPQRDRIEACIADVYRARYGARICHWAPTLVGLVDDERILAAAGYRDAAGPLFLERYLAAPVEAVLAARTGSRVTRREIVEVGHFAAAETGEGKRLLPLLARHLSQLGYRWVVSTATRELRVLLALLGMRPLALARADPGPLGADAAHWGSYYEHEPVVVAGDLRRSRPVIERGRRQS
jgi:hypothetical protein